MIAILEVELDRVIRTKIGKTISKFIYLIPETQLCMKWAKKYPKTAQKETLKLLINSFGTQDLYDSKGERRLPWRYLDMSTSGECSLDVDQWLDLVG